MEHIKIVEKGKTLNKKGTSNDSARSKASIVDEDLDIKLTLDNSLKRFASEGFFIEHAKKIDKKFSQYKSTQ